ncbi:MAG: FHA domain-containing protein [Chloroflexi bacterium]|nr:FHA domain-containing protein [Chloroflexota bacterium]
MMGQRRLVIVIRFLLAFLIALYLLPSHLIPTGAQEDPPPLEIDILFANANFPQVNLLAQVKQGPTIVSELTEENFAINEDHEGLTVTSEAMPINLVVVVDLSEGTDVDLIRTVLNNYFQNEAYYRDGDRVAIVTQTEDNYRLRTGETLPDIQQILNNLPSNSGYNSSQPGIEAAAEHLEQFSADQAANHILVVGSVFNRPNQVEQLPQRIWQEQGIQIHTIHAYDLSSRARFATDFEAVAQQGGGLFAQYQGGSLAGVTSVFDAIQSSRTLYQIIYNSLNATSGEHTVQLSVNIDGASAAASFTYQGPELQDPQVEITDPASGAEVVREPIIEGNQITGFTPELQDIQVEVSFPDGFERDITQVTLTTLINGDEVSQVIPEPEVGSGGTMVLAWDLVPIEAMQPPGNERAGVTFQVQVTDEYNRSGESAVIDATIVLNVPEEGGVLEPRPTRPPRNTEPTPRLDAAGGLDTGTVGPPPEEAEAASAASTEESDDNSMLILGVAIVAAFFALLVTGFGFLMLRQRRRQAVDDYYDDGYGSSFNKTMPAMSVSGGDIGQTMASSQKIYGHLQILNGPDTGRQIPIDSDQFTIGREVGPGINFTTPGFDNVSSRHCIIGFRDNAYYIIDQGSTNGTFVNGVDIGKLIEPPLRGQETIQLGKDPGSSIQFRFMPRANYQPPVTPGKTRIDMDPVSNVPPAPSGPPPSSSQGWGSSPPPSSPSPGRGTYGSRSPQPRQDDWEPRVQDDDSWLDGGN